MNAQDIFAQIAYLRSQPRPPVAGGEGEGEMPSQSLASDGSLSNSSADSSLRATNVTPARTWSLAGAPLAANIDPRAEEEPALSRISIAKVEQPPQAALSNLFVLPKLAGLDELRQSSFQQPEESGLEADRDSLAEDLLECMVADVAQAWSAG